MATGVASRWLPCGPQRWPAPWLRVLGGSGSPARGAWTVGSSPSGPALPLLAGPDGVLPPERRAHTATPQEVGSAAGEEGAAMAATTPTPAFTQTEALRELAAFPLVEALFGRRSRTGPGTSRCRLLNSNGCSY